MKIRNQICSAALACIIALSLYACSAPGLSPEAEEALSNTAEYMLNKLKEPKVGSVGGEWAVLGLARSGLTVPDGYFDGYYNRVAAYVEENNGVLHSVKYTEYSRVIIALTAIGRDPANVGGYNLLTPLGDFEKTIIQGINGPVFALIALDSGKYDMPVNPGANIQATRDMFIEDILSRQLEDWGFALGGSKEGAGKNTGSADVDLTAMTLQALAGYQDRTEVKEATDKALNCVSGLQKEGGYFLYQGEPSLESTAQVLVALCELGIDINDERFVKNGNTALDGLLMFFEKDKGFHHSLDEADENFMSTEQGFYALAAAKRAARGENPLYRIK